MENIENTCCPGAEVFIGLHGRHWCWYCESCRGPITPVEETDPPEQEPRQETSEGDR